MTWMIPPDSFKNIVYLVKNLWKSSAIAALKLYITAGNMSSQGLVCLYHCWALSSTFLIASSCLCLLSLAACSCLILFDRSSSSTCCLCRSSLLLSRDSRCGDGSPSLSSWMHVWMAAERPSERGSSDSVSSITTSIQASQGGPHLKETLFVLMLTQKSEMSFSFCFTILNLLLLDMPFFCLETNVFYYLLLFSSSFKRLSGIQWLLYLESILVFSFYLMRWSQSFYQCTWW